MILRSNIGANVQDAKTASFLWFLTTFHISRQHMQSVGPYFAVTERGGRDLRHRHVLGPTLSLIYFILKHFN